MVPTVIVGSGGAGLAQKAIAAFVENPELITMTGLFARYTMGPTAFILSYRMMNRERLIDETGQIDKKRFMGELSAVASSSPISLSAAVFTYGTVNEVLVRSGVDPGLAGIVSSVSASVASTIISGTFAPRIHELYSRARTYIRSRNTT